MSSLGEIQNAMQYNRQQQSAPWQAGGDILGSLAQILMQIIANGKQNSANQEAQGYLNASDTSVPPPPVTGTSTIPIGGGSPSPVNIGGKTLSFPQGQTTQMNTVGQTAPVQTPSPDISKILAMLVGNQYQQQAGGRAVQALQIGQSLTPKPELMSANAGDVILDKRTGRPVYNVPNKPLKPELPGGFAQMSPDQQAIEYNKIYPGANVTADSFKSPQEGNPDWKPALNPTTKQNEYYDVKKNKFTGVRVPENASSAAMAPMLGKDALDMQAEQYLSMGNLPQTGFGLAGTKMRADIITRAAQMQKERGLPQQILATNKAAYAANQSALTQMTKMSQNIDAYTSTALKNMDLALQQSAKVPRTGSPLVNRFYQWVNGQQLIGNPELTRFETYIYTAAREYAKVTQGAAMSAAGLTDSAAREVEKLINAAQTPGAFPAAVQAMKEDMANVRSSYEQQKSELQDRIGQLSGRPQATQITPQTGTDQFIVGKQYKDANGNTATYQGNGQWK